MDSVKIKISVGVKSSRKITPGLGVYGAIAHLHNAEISVNPEKTWLAEFQENFGISFNPETYIIQRHQHIKAKQFPQRSLTEKIGEWVSKDFRYNKNKAVFGVELINLFKNEPVIFQSTQKAKGLGALFVFKSAGVVLRNEDLSPELETLHEKWFRVKDPLMTWLDIFSKHFGVDLDPERYFAGQYISKSRAAVKEHDLRETVQQLLQDFPKIYPNRANTILIVEREDRPISSREECVAPAGVTPCIEGSTPRGQRNAKRERQFQVSEPNQVAESYSAVYDFIATDDESTDSLPKVKEVYQSGGSQAQNNEPCPGKRNCYNTVKPENNEFQNEDIREDVYNLASKFTNSQLLKARNEILKLKEMSQCSEARDPWSNWNTTCPLPAAILRDFFEV